MMRITAFLFVIATAAASSSTTETLISQHLKKPVHLSPNSLTHRHHRDHDPIDHHSITQQQQQSLSSITQTPRGGAKPSSNELIGVSIFLFADHALRKLFQTNKIEFPSQLAGCMIFFVGLLVMEMIVPGSGDRVFEGLAPGAALLAKWLPVFFVPGLAMLPLAPSMGGVSEILKVVAVTILGFFYTLSTTAFSVLGLRLMKGATNEVTSTASTTQSSSSAPAPKAYSDETMNFLVKCLILTSIISLSASKLDHPLASPLQTLFLICSTVTTFTWGSRLPSSITKYIHPIIIATLGTLLTIQLTSQLTDTTFHDLLKTFKTGTLTFSKAGAGDILLHLLGPTVVSLSIAMYSRKNLVAQNLLVVLTAMLVGSIGSLFGTAFAVRLAKIGGEAGRVLRISILPRNVTTALAIAISNLMGGDISITASVVCFTGIFGATVGARALDAMGVYDPVSRGLGIGTAAQGLGVASIVNEKDAFPFAAIAMVLMAVSGTTLVSIPVVKDMLLGIVGGVVEEVVGEGSGGAGEGVADVVTAAVGGGEEGA